MRLWIGLYLPQLPLEVFSPRWRTDGGAAAGATAGAAAGTAAGAIAGAAIGAASVLAPHTAAGVGASFGNDAGSVVLEQERVMALSPLARAAGVQPGMRRGGVLMLMPEARIELRSHSNWAGSRPSAASASACGAWGGCSRTIRRSAQADSAGRSRRISPMPGCCSSKSTRVPLGQPPPGSWLDNAAWPVSMQRVSACASCDARHNDGCKASGAARMDEQFMAGWQTNTV